MSLPGREALLFAHAQTAGCPGEKPWPPCWFRHHVKTPDPKGSEVSGEGNLPEHNPGEESRPSSAPVHLINVASTVRAVTAMPTVTLPPKENALFKRILVSYGMF